MQRSLFIVSSPRSGSSWFVDALAQTGLAGRPDEYFRELNYQEVRRQHDLPPDAPLDRVFTILSATERTPNGVFAAKLMGRQVEPLLRALGEWREEWRDAGLRKLLEAFFGPATFVWLRRRDLLAQAVSFVKAEQSGQWRAVGSEHFVEGRNEKAQFVFNPLTIAQARDRFEREEAILRECFEHEQIEPLELFYEDLLDDLGPCLEAVLQRIGEAGKIVAGDVESKLRPQRDALNERWRTAFEEWQKGFSPAAREVVDLAGNLRIEGANGEHLRLAAERPMVVRCVLESAACETWPVGENAQGVGAVGVGFFCFDAARKEIFALRRFVPLLRPLEGGGATELELLIGPFPEPGAFRLFFQLQQRGERPKPRAVGAGCSLDLEVLPAENPKADLVERRNNGGCRDFAAYWSGAVKELPFHFWKWQEGFGYFQTLGWPWMQHSEQGFWRFFGSGDATGAGWWFFDHVLGVCWSSSEDYPVIWAARSETWLEFLSVADGLRRFQIYPSGKNVSLPRSEPSARIAGGWRGEQ